MRKSGDASQAYITAFLFIRLLDFRFTQATELATVALQGTPTTACLDAMTTALCAYHFPRCEFDEKRFPAVCYDTCQTLKMQCKIDLDDIVLVQESIP
jgi:hypothetical protein